MRVQVLIFNDDFEEDVLGRIIVTHAEVSGSLKGVTITGDVQTVQGGSLPVGWLPRTLYPDSGGASPSTDTVDPRGPKAR